MRCRKNRISIAMAQSRTVAAVEVVEEPLTKNQVLRMQDHLVEEEEEEEDADMRTTEELLQTEAVLKEAAVVANTSRVALPIKAFRASRALYKWNWWLL